jgi:PAS domain S-box-containing protein
MLENKIGTPDWLRHMEGILEELNEGVAIVDDQLRIVFANEALERMGQYECGELQWRTLDAIFPPKDIPRILKQHESGLRNGHSRTEFYVPAKNGNRIPAIFSGRPIRSPDRQEHMLVTVTDISAQKRVEEQLRESNALLEQRYNEMETELSLAARVQRSLAPQSLVWNDASVESYYSPARTIGGDFGVVFPHGDELLSVLLCDVSGHGIGSALMANRIYSETLHQLERKSTPIELLKHVHAFVHDRLATDSFYFTMAAVRLSMRGHRAHFAAAGHPPAILLSNGVVRLLESQNGILGCLSETAPSEAANEIDLASGDRLVLYTDGLVEVFNTHQEMLGIEAFSQLVLDAANRPLPEMRQAIINGVAAWRRGPLADDVSLIILEIR